MNPGARYRINKLLTAIHHAEDCPARMLRLRAGTWITVAGFMRSSLFVQVLADGLLCEVLIEDLYEAATRVNDGAYLASAG
jgi:hypothetical protein